MNDLRFKGFLLLASAWFTSAAFAGCPEGTASVASGIITGEGAGVLAVDDCYDDYNLNANRVRASCQLAGGTLSTGQATSVCDDAIWVTNVPDQEMFWAQGSAPFDCCVDSTITPAPTMTPVYIAPFVLSEASHDVGAPSPSSAECPLPGESIKSPIKILNKVLNWTIGEHPGLNCAGQCSAEYDDMLDAAKLELAPYMVGNNTYVHERRPDGDCKQIKALTWAQCSKFGFVYVCGPTNPSPSPVASSSPTPTPTTSLTPTPTPTPSPSPSP